MKVIKEYIPYLIIVMVVVITRIFIITPVQVSGHSMDPTLSNNQLVMLYKLSNNDYERFDIVVSDITNPRIIKRVIGLPGEAVRFKDGDLLINNVVVYDPFAIITEDFDFGVVAQGHFIVMGDNRAHSADSRILGQIPASNLGGTVNFSIFPFKTFGKIE